MWRRRSRIEGDKSPRSATGCVAAGDYDVIQDADVDEAQGVLLWLGRRNAKEISDSAVAHTFGQVLLPIIFA
jgi:hypothetical protein